MVKILIYLYIILNTVIFVLGALDLLSFKVSALSIGGLALIFIIIIETLSRKGKIGDIKN